MKRAFCIPGIVFLFSAFVLLILVSISLPFLTAIDFVRIHVRDGDTVVGDGITEIRLGAWGACLYRTNGDRTCSEANSAYSVTISGQDTNDTQTIGASWTRGLAIHPVAAAITFVALLLSFSQHITVTLVSSLMSFLAATLTLIAFSVDIALYVYTRNQANDITGGSYDTDTSSAFWMTFVALIFLLLAGCTVCFGRRKERLSGASTYPTYPMTSVKPTLWDRVRRRT